MKLKTLLNTVRLLKILTEPNLSRCYIPGEARVSRGVNCHNPWHATSDLHRDKNLPGLRDE